MFLISYLQNCTSMKRIVVEVQNRTNQSTLLKRVLELPDSVSFDFLQTQLVLSNLYYGLDVCVKFSICDIR